jgi:hypothetical protein
LLRIYNRNVMTVKCCQGQILAVGAGSQTSIAPIELAQAPAISGSANVRIDRLGAATGDLCRQDWHFDKKPQTKKGAEAPFEIA